MKILRMMIVLWAGLVLAGCTSLTVEHQPYHDRPDARKLAVFLDGTGNDENSQSNIAKLHSMVRLRPDPRIHTQYVRGVGLNGRVLGLAMGVGIGEDVRQAYWFLARNYRPEMRDEIYLFGFSRGAYAARILAGLIYVAGLPDLSAIPDRDDQEELISDIYDAYEGRETLAGRRARIAALKLPPMRQGIRITFMGLWDTVEALDVPDYREKIDEPNRDYVDQLCNVERAAHALSIDDNRATLFTPILLTRIGLVDDCPELQDRQARLNHIDRVVQEVWFSGSHTDVGGGYAGTNIDGVSLNWMLRKIARFGLVPDGAAVYANFADRTHDPAGTVLGYIYNKQNRSLAEYYSGRGDSLSGKLKLHRSVIDRLALCPVKDHESRWFAAAGNRYGACFRQLPDGRMDFRGCPALIDVVEDDYDRFDIRRCHDVRGVPTS